MNAKTTKCWGWPKVPPRFTAAALAGHSAVGLAFGALIYLVCLTGTVSVLVDEMKLVEQPTPAAASPKSGALNAAIAAALAKGPATNLYAIAPVTPRQRLTVSTSGPSGERSYIADAEGRLTPLRTPFTDFVTELHMTLTAPAPWGSLVVGLIGAALLSLILSGVLSHPRIFRDAFRLKLNGSERLREAELHNRLSVWGLPFHVAVTLTGALFGLANLAVMTVAAIGFHGNIGRVYAPIVGPEPKADAVAAPLPDIEAIVARATAAMPGARLYYVGIERPLTRGSRIRVEVTAPTRLPRGEDFYFDAAGREIGRGRFATGDLGLQAFSGAAQLHFGFFGGLPVRLVYVLLGAALTFVSASGITIWLARQADKGHPRPRFFRAWLAWTWGVPFSLAMSALLSPTLSVPETFVVSCTAIQIGTAVIGRRREYRKPI